MKPGMQLMIILDLMILSKPTNAAHNALRTNVTKINTALPVALMRLLVGLKEVKTMRTQKEILARIEEAKKRDPLGFEWKEYLECLTFDNLKRFLKKDIDEKELDQIKAEYKPKTSDEIKKQAIDYLEFAWNKCENERGISANRSIMHYQAWLWLMGEDDFDDLMDDYDSYGRPQLKRIQKFLGIEDNPAH